MIKLSSNSIPQSDLELLADWLKTNPKLSQGKFVHDFERKVADKMGVAHALMVSSGSNANRS